MKWKLWPRTSWLLLPMSLPTCANSSATEAAIMDQRGVSGDQTRSTYMLGSQQPKQRTTIMLRRLLPCLFVLLWNYDLPAQTPYYQGKTIRLVAGTPPAKVYDSYVRPVGRVI